MLTVIKMEKLWNFETILGKFNALGICTSENYAHKGKTSGSKGGGRSRRWPRPRACRGLACLATILVCIGIAFSPYIVAVVCLIHVLSSETINNKAGTEVFDKSLWRENYNFLNAFHNMVLLMAD
jgi:hypothetical protein